MYWEPVKPQQAETVSTGTKWVLQKRFGYEGAVLTDGDISYLEGVSHAQTGENEIARDCAALIAAINRHEAVRIWIA